MKYQRKAFEKSLLEIQKLVPDKKIEKIQKRIRNIANELAKITPISSVDIMGHLCNLALYPDLFEKELKILEKILDKKQND